jgi:hypothetical protein
MSATENFTVKTCYGTGWRIPQAPECPKWMSQSEAMRYAELRNQGMPHIQAWHYTNSERKPWGFR